MKSITDAVEETLGGMFFLNIAFKQDVVNYSALARVIKPTVDKEAGGDAGLDAITMAIKRYAEELRSAEPKRELVASLKDCTLVMRTDLVGFHVKNWRNRPMLLETLQQLIEKTVDWHAGEKCYVMHRTSEMYILASSKFRDQILSAVGENLLLENKRLAIMTINFPPQSLEIPGVVAFFATQLAQMNVNIRTCFETYKKLSFVIDEKDVGKAYETLNSAITSVRESYGDMFKE